MSKKRFLAKKHEVCHRRWAHGVGRRSGRWSGGVSRGRLRRFGRVSDVHFHKNMGRIVTDVVDVCGDVVVLADPNVSLLAQEVCSAVNRGGGRPLIAVEDTGAPSHLTRCFYTGFAPGARESSHGACPVPGVSGHGRASGAQHVGSWYDGTAPRSPGRGPRVWRGNRARPDVL